MRRLLRRWLGKVLPEFVKRRYRDRLFGFRRTRAVLPFALTQDAAGDWTATIGDRGLRLRALPEICGDLRYMLQENGACVEEMSGFLREAVRSECLFDIGAHVGLFSLLFCLVSGSKRAVAYEPSPPLMQRARALGELNGVNARVRWEQCAVGNTVGMETFALATTGLSAGFATASAHDGSDETLSVRLVTLDEECARLGTWPDLLKIDVEGYEWEVLQGAPRLLAERRPILLLELHTDILECSGVRPRTITDYLARFGYAFETPLGQPLAAGAVYDSVEAVFRIVARAQTS